MANITQDALQQNEIIVHSPCISQQLTDNEEGDITETTMHHEAINSIRRPSQSSEESDSEEDVTEESGNYNSLITGLEHLSLQTSPNEPEQTTTEPTRTTSLISNNNNNINNRGRSISSAASTTSTANNIGLLPRSQRVWEMDRQVPDCRRCHRRFNFLVRRHHCRRCGQIVCDRCSSNRIRLSVEELIEDPMVSPSQYPLLASQFQRVCDRCYREPVRRSSESYQRRKSYQQMYRNSMRRTDSSQSLMIDCPVCGESFLGMKKDEQEEHLQRCLNVGSPPVHLPRYIGKVSCFL
ncbi:MAG: FYVE zinc finger-domain-containing protein [Benjaminiella poitrasii]|nr:MAG: FYVE zinc finger-domain-containing protein [Benjaminiella poitrasii]